MTRTIDHNIIINKIVRARLIYKIENEQKNIYKEGSKQKQDEIQIHASALRIEKNR